MGVPFCSVLGRHETPVKTLQGTKSRRESRRRPGKWAGVGLRISGVMSSPQIGAGTQKDGGGGDAYPGNEWSILTFPAKNDKPDVGGCEFWTQWERGALVGTREK